MPVTIATPVDGSYETTPYPASGDMTAAAVKTAFSYYTNRVTVMGACRELSCLRQNRPSGYYVIPEILHWEERATEWSGLPDKIEVKTRHLWPDRRAAAGVRGPVRQKQMGDLWRGSSTGFAA
nr:hypothetical protein GCM10020185_06470 [Pseudomonas brassicacearum subsp. brassicacearum]